MFLVVGMAAFASGTPFYLKVVDIGESDGRTGTEQDPLMPSDVVGIEVWVEYDNAQPSYTFYSGWSFDGLDIALTASGPGTLDLDFGGMVSHPSGGEPQWHPQYGSWAGNAVVETNQKIAIDGNFGYNAWSAGVDNVKADLRFLEGFRFHCEGNGEVLVDLVEDGPRTYNVMNNGTNVIATSWSYWMYLGGNAHGPIYGIGPYLGDIVIHQIPEPFTLGLLGLGGLALIRRRLF
jgi:hypothetical protein